MGRRRHPRTEVKLRVQLWGTDQSGHRFMEVAWTEDLSQSGTHIRGVCAPLRLGQVVGLTYGEQQNEFRVAWVGEPGTPYESHAGLVELRASTSIWGVNLPPARPDNYVSPSDRRQHARFKCFISALLRPAGTTLPVWGQVTDISSGGCYVQTGTPLAVNSRLTIELLMNDSRLKAEGMVCSNHPGQGMGLKFLEMSDQHHAQVQQFVKWFASTDSAAAGAGSQPPIPPTTRRRT
ncbi:MAG TPA: PilZ domain-containing protein [Terriglobales bacterium]|nr:PilZ domain-containing protein [Terriglobales bacterium]